MRTLLALLALCGVARADGSCALTTDSWTSVVSLRGAPDGAPFARLRGWGKGPRATVALGDVMGASLSGNGLDLHVVAETGDWLHTRAPMKFGKILTTPAGAIVSLRDVAALEIELKPPGDFTPAAPLKQAVKCEELAIGAVKPNNGRAGLGLPKKLRAMVLRQDVDIPIAAEPAGTPEGTLHVSADSNDVEVVRAAKGWTLIVVERFNSILYGWVPSGFVQKPQPEGGVLGGIMGGLGGLGLSGTGGVAPPKKKCAAALRVFLRQRGRMGPEVGMIQPGTELYAHATDATWTEVTFPDLNWLELLSGNQLVVSSGDLARCDERSLDR
jgi:hypothetical protein